METEDRKRDSGVKDEKAGTGKSRADRNTSAADTTAGTGTGGTRAGGTGKTEAGKQAEKVSELSTVKEPKVVEVVPPQPKAKRTQKKATKAKPEKNTELITQMTALITGVSNVAASRPYMKHWAISQKEAQSIAEPLANIIEKSESLKAIAEHSDGLALTVACATVFLPRIMITAEVMKQEKALNKKGVLTHGNSEKTENTKAVKQDNGNNALTDTNVSKSVLDVLQPADF